MGRAATSEHVEHAWLSRNTLDLIMHTPTSSIKVKDEEMLKRLLFPPSRLPSSRVITAEDGK